MIDAQDVEVKIGDRVAYRTPKGLLTGIVVRLRMARRYQIEYETAKIQLDIPLRRFNRALPLRNPDGAGYMRDESGWPMYAEPTERTPLLFGEVYDGKNLIVIPKKEDLTNAEKGVE